MIEVGEYIRTSNGIIAKLERIKSELRYKYWANNGECYTEKAIKKHSFNIIDLIEKGDYVNGKEIIMNLEKSKKWYNSEDDFVTAKGYTYNEDEIKSIVTKEQFENTEYVI